MGEAKPLAQEDLNLTGELVVRAEWGWGELTFLSLTFVLPSPPAGNKRGGDVGCCGGVEGYPSSLLARGPPRPHPAELSL